jgi:hypothetical protein
MPPKPCLKSQLRSESDPLPFASCPRLLLSPHVHFPPTPTLTSTHIADSPWTYDRAPIAISPNSCALPERGARMYTPASESWNRTRATGSYFHPGPNAYEACELELCGTRITMSPPPPLIPDFSSESDESDGSVVTPPELNTMIPPISVHSAHHTQQYPITYPHSQEKLDNAHTFLPHAPSPPRKKEKGRKRSLSRPRHWDVKSTNDFAEPALDGCLGGF